MKRIVMMAGCIVASCALGGVAAATAAAAPPEFGSCVEVAPKTGEYAGRNCLAPAPGKGRFNWVPGGAGNKKFTTEVGSLVFKTAGGGEVSCVFGEGEGEYTGGKTLSVTKLILSDCKTAGAKTVFESWCQNIGAFRGEVTANELAGELGYFEKNGKKKVGIDLKAKSGTALATFECGGASEITEHGMGTGTLLELEGSVIGEVKKLNKPFEENLVVFAVKAGAQLPEQFEGGVKDTLITNIVVAKTTEATTLATLAEVVNGEPIEVKAK
jgi:hypothetical protein